MKALNIIETAYRATLEEQDDTIVWITGAMRGAGGDLDILLRRSAVNYAVTGQDASGLVFGDWHQTQPPHIADDLAGLIEKGVGVFVVSEDLEALGITRDSLVPGVKPIIRSDIAGLIRSHDQVWHW